MLAFYSAEMDAIAKRVFGGRKTIQNLKLVTEQKRLKNDQKGFYLPRFLHRFSTVENRGMPVV